MRIGLIPQGTRDRLILRSHRFPLPVFDVMGTMLLSRAVMAGVHFGVFDRLAAGGPKTAAELAAETNAGSHGMRLLLDALAACGYLERQDSRYRNTRLSARWLLSDAPQTLVNFVRFNYDQWEWVSHLEEFVQQGAARNIHERLEGRGWRNYLLGLRDLAALSIEELVEKLKFRTPPRRLVDVGGGHCLHAIALCRRYPALQATIVDLEPAARLGREQVEEAGLSGRVEFRIGHLAETGFGAHHDVAFVFNVLHHLDEETNRVTLRRLAAALAPHGKLVVWETFREEKAHGAKDQLGSLLALFFGVTSREETLSFEQVAEWAGEAGFRQIRRENLRSAPHAALLVASK